MCPPIKGFILALKDNPDIRSAGFTLALEDIAEIRTRPRPCPVSRHRPRLNGLSAKQ